MATPMIEAGSRTPFAHVMEIYPPGAPLKAPKPVKQRLDFDNIFEIKPMVLDFDDFQEDRPRKRARTDKR
jgi:hypothetical protein